MLADAANDAWQVHAIAAFGTACRRRGVRVWRVGIIRLSAMKTTTATGNGTDRAATDAQSFGNLSLGQALMEEPVDFANVFERVHRRQSLECGVGSGELGARLLVFEPEVAVVGLGVAFLVVR